MTNAKPLDVLALIVHLQEHIAKHGRLETIWENRLLVANDSFTMFERPKRETVSLSAYPASYVKNSSLETLILEHVRVFFGKFRHHFPQRMDLVSLFCATNECGTSKVACSFIRPTRLPFHECADAKLTAEFVSDAINFVVPSDPFIPPSSILSPSTLLAHREGTSVDYACLLTSVLKGAGYDAYCVAGYATKETSLFELSDQHCDALDPIKPQTKMGVEMPPSAYEQHITAPLCYESEFLAILAARARDEAEKNKEKEKETDQETALEVNEKEKEGKQSASEKKEQSSMEEEKQASTESSRRFFHCWVLIRKGPHDLDEDLFIEPVSGKLYPAKEKTDIFTGIEAVWNDQNIWINMQALDTTVLNFTFSDLTFWETVICNSEKDKPPKKKVIPKCPVWVLDLKLTKLEFEDRFPNCQKKLIWKDCIQEKFSVMHFGNGLVERLTLTSNYQTEPFEIREVYSKRADCLCRKVTKFVDDRIASELYEFVRGRSDGLEYILVDQEHETHTLMYYTEDTPRKDHLKTRVTIKDRKIIETFENRSDLLIERKANLIVEEASALADVVHLVPSDDSDLHQITKLSLRFERNPSQPSGSCVHRMSFRVRENQLAIAYHLDEGQIVHPKRWYDKNGTTTSFEVDPMKSPLTERELGEDLRKYSEIEKKSIVEIQKNEIEERQLLLQHDRDCFNPTLVLSTYDTEKRKLRLLPAKRNDETTHITDFFGKQIKDVVAFYVLPYLNLLKKEIVDVTPEEAVSIKQACLASFRDRVEAKEHVLLTHISETKALQKRHTKAWNLQYEQSGVHPEKVVEEQHRKLMESLAFSLTVFDRRLKMHEEEAPRRFAELDECLSSYFNLRA